MLRSDDITREMTLRSRPPNIWFTLLIVAVISRIGLRPAFAQLGHFQIKLLSLNLHMISPMHLAQPGSSSDCDDDNASLVITACLSHHQLPLPRTLECTLGRNRTQLQLPLDDGWDRKPDAILLLPFSFSWPGAYTLSITVVRECPALTKKGVLLSELMLADFISPSTKWMVIVLPSRYHPTDSENDQLRARQNTRGSHRVISKRHLTKSGHSGGPVTSLTLPRGRSNISPKDSLTPMVNVIGRELRNEKLRLSSSAGKTVIPTSKLVSRKYKSLFDSFHHSTNRYTQTKSLSSRDRKYYASPFENSRTRFGSAKQNVPTTVGDHSTANLSGVSMRAYHATHASPTVRLRRETPSNDDDIMEVTAQDVAAAESGVDEEPDDFTTEGDEDEDNDTEDLALSTDAVVRVHGLDVMVAVRVTCTQHYFGRSCSELCRPRDDLHGHYSCNEQGRRLCLPGWTGDGCSQAVCSDRCQANRGVCSQPGLCTCRPGWYGEHCDKCRTAAGCAHGTCHLAGQCVCHKGWTGPLCDVETRFCLDNNPCLNGGTCHHDSSHNYTCSCTRGYAGAHCEVSECHSNFCMHSGTCQVTEGTRYCLCQPRYTGPRCQHKMDNLLASTSACEEPPCTSPLRAPCKGADCVDEMSDDIRSENPCNSGPLCVQEARRLENPCLTHICYNGGRCVLGKNTDVPKCRCPPPFLGEHCLRVANSSCTLNPCMNGGTCRTNIRTGSFRCTCAAGYSGKICQKHVGAQKGTTFCGGENKVGEAVVACHNDGQCVRSRRDKAFFCRCSSNYTGEFCELKSENQCTGHTCLHGGTCKIETVNSTPACLCPAGYDGARCERREVKRPCARTQCQHGSACLDLPNGDFRCICRVGYEGKFCETTARQGGLLIEIRTDCCNSGATGNVYSWTVLNVYILIIYITYRAIL